MSGSAVGICLRLTGWVFFSFVKRMKIENVCCTMYVARIEIKLRLERKGWVQKCCPSNQRMPICKWALTFRSPCEWRMEKRMEKHTTDY